MEEMILINKKEFNKKLYECIEMFNSKGRIEDADTRGQLNINIHRVVNECDKLIPYDEETKDESYTKDLLKLAIGLTTYSILDYSSYKFGSMARKACNELHKKHFREIE